MKIVSKFFKCLWQVAFLYLLALVGNFIAETFHLVIPGSIIGLIVLFLLLSFNVVKLEWVEIGANWLLAELLLFFIPSAVGVVQYTNITASVGMRIFLVIVLSTAAVMACTALFAEFMTKRRKKVQHHEHIHSHL